MEKTTELIGFPYRLMIYPSTAEIPAQIRRHFQLPTAPRGEETGSLNTEYSLATSPLILGHTGVRRRLPKVTRMVISN
jgi:hypothetical protein